MIERQRLERMVADQLAMIGNPACRVALHSILVEPRLEVRGWDYGAEGERHPCWVVAEEPAKGVILVYCEQGFGPEFPCGFLYTDEPEPASLGMDSQWNWYLEEAFVRADLWNGPMDEVLHLPPEERFPSAGPAEQPGPAVDSGLNDEAQISCRCRRSPFHFADYDTVQLGEDSHGAEVSLATCKHCGTVWLEYLIEEPHHSRSGRWWRVEVPPESKDKVSADMARELIELQPQGFVGGSFFSSQGRAVTGPIRVA